ncbi:RNA polymerase sigma factor SigF [Actinocrispum wychmicini]|uniref:RNA polymerase sigma-B factor n=1 Tax=Actinocrispum wychmicini TaxID=1213861 RepID=A0A4R2IX68_9PSEU|nr:RNA polymerase sigma factor SigF [Actinocrispum wychmicini]TCO48858.1 RNA polymerase sigma-B factor [Actinocrispum wychmicini]
MNPRGGYDHLAPLFVELAALPQDSAERRELRERLVTEHMPVAEHIARRFAHQGAPLEDLSQVAKIGLINAVDRFDPEHGADFMSFAVPTIMGEVRRHIRDTSWAVHVPRRLKEMRMALSGAVTELSQRLGRAPTPSQIAEHLGVSREDVFEGLEATNAHHSLSLDYLLTDDPDSASLADTLGSDDPELSVVDAREALYPLIKRLPERQQKIITLRFFGNLTQTQIAEALGISQMHVSRLLAKSLDQLRAALEEG